jgi:hypothetical protein
MAERTVQDRLRTLQWPALAVGVLALVACVIGAVLGGAPAFFRAYLYSYIFWFGISGGALVWQMIQNLTGGRWGMMTRQVAESASLTLPLMVILMIPIFFGLPDLFVWAQPHATEHYQVLVHRTWYLNTPFFIARGLFYAIFFSVTAWLLARWSHVVGDAPQSAPARHMRALSAFGLVAYGFLITHFSVDFIQSRDLHMGSTVFGMMLGVCHANGAMALIVLVLAAFSAAPEVRRITDGGLKKNLGNLMLVDVILWAYLAFVQFVSVWMGNTRETIEWFVQRGLNPEQFGVWTWIGGFILVFGFFVPFLALLFTALKDRWGGLAAVAGILFITQLVQAFWFIAPSGPSDISVFTLTWFDVVMPVAIGGIWLANFAFVLARRPIVVRHAEPARGRPVHV